MEATKRAIEVPETAEGEVYVGLIGDQHGNAYHLILLPGDEGERNWRQSKEWAASIGGDLPSRLEQAMLWANCRSEFKRDWYWSNEAEGSGWAWFLYFDGGNQLSTRQGNEFRARAVRRLSIQ
ncbi:DUF1566 domain-containing protein [Burkholderia multivorans]|uniref:DUF1566 domain-containing protein n=1 Tax=Burkholderia multivorans TaxID=87883 RepID=UPI0021C18544|nr:DUF1566 domain-containing protein [Burkholderia multivorans]MDR9052102.1 hypothetical protein [Burkholderia multivorans]MDR9060487.1 hypothetical protein [Burkholderia multivorans]MDR9066401.1 hypothetical protein [Burkholderia multivorans]MDR9072357.1 hypothetical protein [Burkholderia multivorans]MDR9078345.1 hypothetical protein [Burkholderia multivorans]